MTVVVDSPGTAESSRPEEKKNSSIGTAACQPRRCDDVITVVRDPHNTLGKRFTLNPDGTVSKASAVNVALGIAVMHRVETHEDLARLLNEVAEDSHAAVINAGFDGIDVGEEFVILSERELEKWLGVASSDRARQQGVHQIEYQDKNYKAVGRFKENVYPSSWQYFDRDVDAHTPKKFAGMAFEEWVLAIGELLPGLSGVSYVRTPSTSTRVLRDGVALGGGNGHAWVKIIDPQDVERFRTAMIIRAAEVGMTWRKPRHSRKDPAKVIGHSLATIVDPSVWTPGRLVFIGQPVVSGGLTVAPLSAIVRHRDHAQFDTSTASLPNGANVRRITRAAGVEMDVQSGSSGLKITARDLTLDTEIETEVDGTLTVRELLERAPPGKVRCQSPFRDSGSFAAFYGVGADGKPFVHDVGTSITHWLNDAEAEGWKSIATKADGATDALAAMQARYALINIDGRVWVLDQAIVAARTGQGTAQKLVLSNRSDGTLLITRAVKAQFPEAKAAEIAKDFFLSPETVCYGGVEFNPAGTTGNRLNLWLGPTLIPKAGAWKLIQAFLLEVICNGDQQSYSYLVAFIAQALQRPWEKPGILIILLGGQGTGKGTLGRILRLTWSATYLQVHDISAVTGNFNAALERAYIVFMDEALFVGDRRASDALKSLVTEPVIHVNEKHQPARQMHSYHRFFAATNADHLKNTERDDRRDFALRVSEGRKGDHPYWQALNHEIDHGGVEAMVHELLAMDLSGFNVRQKPDTAELLEQKLQSLGPVARWWYECLDSGDHSGEGKWTDFISTGAAIAGIVDVAGGRLYRKPAASEVVRELQKLCPSAEKTQRQDNFARHRGLRLPSLEQARKEFEHYLGGTVKW